MSPMKALKKIGKAQAREQFAPLVEALASGGGVVEVTDYGKVVAVMLGYKEFLRLLAHASERFEPERQLAGSAVLAGDLEQASREIVGSVLDSIEKQDRHL